MASESLHHRLAPAAPAPVTPWWNSPVAVFLFLLILTTVMLVAVRSEAVKRTYVSALMLLGGITGIVLYFLAFISIHPFTHPNVNLWLFNPLQIVAIPFLWGKLRRSRVGVSLYFLTFAGVIVFFVTSVMHPRHLTTALLGVNYLLIYLYASPLSDFIKGSKLRNKSRIAVNAKQQK